MVTLLTLIHVLCAMVLILVVLLQSARGTDLAGAFGGMGSQTAFGPRGTSNFLSKTTAVLAAVFMVTSLSLAIMSNHGRRSGSVLSGEKAAPASQQKAPAMPAQLPAQQLGITPGQITPIQPAAPPPASGKQTAPGAPQVKVVPVAPAAPSGGAPAPGSPQQQAPPAEPPAPAPAPPAGQ